VSDKRRARIQATLATIRAEYLAELPAQIERLADAAQRAPADAAALGEAAAEAHRIRGTAGSLGLWEIGNAAGRLEDALDRAAAGDPSWVTIAAEVSTLVALMRR